MIIPVELKSYKLNINFANESNDSAWENKLCIPFTNSFKLNIPSLSDEISYEHIIPNNPIEKNINPPFIIKEKKLEDIEEINEKPKKQLNKSKIKFNKSLNNKDQNKLLSSEKNLIKNKKQLNLNLNLNISINNYLSRSQSIKNTHSLENKLKNVISPKNYINVKSKFIEPNENFIPEDFTLIKQIGEGSFGKIYCTQWKKNHLNYALKKMILRNKIEIKN